MAVVEPSSAPRRFVASTAPSRPDVGRRRKGTSSTTGRKSRLAAGSSAEPPPDRAKTRAVGAEPTTPPPPRSRSRSRSSPSGTRVRNPLARYLLLSVILVVLGLCVRYLWRQLAGLVGAALILSTARRWSGGTTKRKRTPSSTAARSGGGKGASLSAARNTSTCQADGSGPSAAAATGQYADGPGGSRRGGGFADAPEALSRFWEDGGPECKLLVRGPKYVVDRKKIPSGPAAMRLVHVDLFAVEKEVFHVASKGRCRDRVSWFLRSYVDRGEVAPFLFILNILVPGNPVVATVMYWALDGAGDGEEPSSSPSAEAGSSQGTLLKMLERYAEVPGSGYKKLERVRSSSPLPPSTSASAAEVNISSSSSSSSSSSASSSPPAARQPRSSSPPSAPLPSVLEGGNGDLSARNGGINGRSSSDSSVGNGASAIKSSARGEAGPLAGAGTSAPSRQEQQQEQERGRSASGSLLADRKSDPAGLLPEDDFRNQRFKLIPSIVSGPFIVRKAVGNKPALLGRKVSQRYFRGPGYVETDIDVGSSIIAEKIVSLCRGYARSLTVELGICLEGRCEEELPEKVIGAIRLIGLDLDQAEPLLEPSETAAD